MVESNSSRTPVEKGAPVLRSAGQVLLVYSLLPALSVGIMFGVAWDDGDLLGWVLTGVAGLLFFLLVTAGLFILKGKRSGIVLWWIVSPLVLLSFPLGTAAGLYVIISLRRPGAREAVS